MLLKAQNARLINIQNGKPWQMTDRETGEIRKGLSYKAEFTEVTNGKAVIVKVDFKDNPDWAAPMQKILETGKLVNFDCEYSYGNLSLVTPPIVVN